MSVHDGIAAARQALDAPARAVAGLGGHYADSVDLRRLREDVARVGVDLDLLRASPAPAQEAPVPVPVPVGETGYDPAFLVEGADDRDRPG